MTFYPPERKPSGRILTYAIAALVVIVIALAGTRIYRKMTTQANPALPPAPPPAQVNTPVTDAATAGSGTTSQPLMKKARGLDRKRAAG